MNSYQTEQERFWAGEFGNDYIARNNTKEIISSNTALFTQILRKTKKVHSLIEFGANIGMNLHALKILLPNATFSAIEINTKAVIELNKIENLTVYCQSILEFTPLKQEDFVLIKTVLIHINPDMLNDVYKKLYNSSSRYICLAEYYNPIPTEVNYRGHTEKLFKRDFAGEMMNQFPDLNLVDYGFVYHRDPNFPADDITWFLLEKKGSNG